MTKYKLTKERIVQIGRDLKNHTQVKGVCIELQYKDGSYVRYDSDKDGNKEDNW